MYLYNDDVMMLITQLYYLLFNMAALKKFPFFITQFHDTAKISQKKTKLNSNIFSFFLFASELLLLFKRRILEILKIRYIHVYLHLRELIR
jgi:hypothetical protein